ncbi:MAG: hypothetical protein A2146_01170 [Actinobacteria bacterium RBG_16_67_10]|nr:MAG: hypothetical protein A2146_01170 [Actinobacteria bacterium RBG_16_67_10]
MTPDASLKRRILLVEDSATQAEATRAVVAAAGYEVTTATSGEAGLAAFEAPESAFAVVVSDVVMPGTVDGYELCRRIKTGSRGDTPVMLLTGLADPLDIIHGLESGADNFITKPYDPTHLIERLAMLLETRSARQGTRTRLGVQVVFMGRHFTITSDREQILDLLISTFADAVLQNRQLREREQELTAAQTVIARYARSLEAQLEGVLSSVPDVLFSLTPDRQFKYVSRAAASVFGCSPETLTLDYWRSRLHPDDRGKAERALEAAFVLGEPQSVEYRFTCQDGPTRWIQQSFIPAMNGHRRVDGMARDITAQHQAEEALRRSEARYRALFEHQIDGFAHCRMIYRSGATEDFEYIAVNQAFERITGLTDVVGKRVSALVPGLRQSNPEAFEVYDRVARTGTPERFEADVPQLGVVFDIAVYRPAPGEFVAVFSDVTARKLAETALRDSEEYFREFFDNAPIGKVITSPDGKLKRPNPALCAMLGYSAAELQSLTFDDITHPDDQETSRAFARALLADSHTRPLELRYVRKNGSEFWSRVTSRVLRDASGAPRCFMTQVEDIDAGHRAAAELARSEEQFRLIAESIDEVFFITDLTGLCTYVSPAYEKIFGRTCASATAAPWSWTEAFHPDERAQLMRLTAQPDQIPSSGFDVRIVRPDGSVRQLRSRAFPVRDAAGTAVGLVGVSADITDLRAAENQLLHAQKMEAVGRLAGGVAHDFNNVLTVILSYAQMLLQDFPPGDPRAADIGQIVEAVRRAQGLTRQLLAFSRQQVVQPVVLDPNAAIRSVEKMLRRLIGEDIEFVLQLSEVAGSLRADAGHFEQVLMNLAVNARDAMPQGGRLTIAAAAQTVDTEGAQALGLPAAGSWVVISIADTGMGMTPEVRSRIFEPFFTTKDPGRGTGLGLATVYGIVRLSGGHVTVDSALGAGTVFRIYFPRLEAEAPAAALQAEGDVAGGTETIVIAEDDPAVRGVATQILVRHGYTVIVARHGEEALARVAAHRGSVQLVVTDVVMPGMDGVALVQQLRTLHPGVRALFTSGYAGEEIVRRGVLSSGTPFLEKPFTPASLARKVREVLDSKR